MTTIEASRVHKCDFCSSLFQTFSEKNDHILCHCEQECCRECDQNMIRIGENWYILHTTITCIKRSNSPEEQIQHEEYIDQMIVSYETRNESSDVIMDQEEDYLEFFEDKRDIVDEIHIEEYDPLACAEEDQTDLQNTEAEMLDEINSHVTQNSSNNIEVTALNEEQERSVIFNVSERSSCKRKENLERHNALLHTNPSRKRYKCDYCHVEFFHRLDLVVHKKKEHFIDNCQPMNDAVKVNNVSKIRCGEFPVGSIPNNDESHPSDSLYCDACKQTFTTKYTLQRHHVRFHSLLTKHNECDICHMEFFYASELKIHKKNRIESECSLCKKIFCTQSSLDAHLKEHCPPMDDPVKVNNISQVDCGNTSRNDELDPPQSYKCLKCMKIFQTKDFLRLHSADCLPRCDMCEFTTKTKTSLRKNKQQKHRTHMCSYCGKMFKRETHLQSHTNTHTGARPFKCPFEGCSKRFGGYPQRVEHMRMHTGEKPFVCPVEGCDRKFSYSVGLRRHKFSGHGIYTKKHPCQICSEVFPEGVLLNKHMKKHSNE